MISSTVDNQLDLDNLDNAKVAARAREVALAIPGMVSAETSPSTGKLVVRYDPVKTNLSLITRTMSAAGLTSGRAELERYDNLRNYVSQNPRARALSRGNV